MFEGGTPGVQGRDSSSWTICSSGPELCHIGVSWGPDFFVRDAIAHFSHVWMLSSTSSWLCRPKRASTVLVLVGAARVVGTKTQPMARSGATAARSRSCSALTLPPRVSGGGRRVGAQTGRTARRRAARRCARFPRAGSGYRARGDTVPGIDRRMQVAGPRKGNDHLIRGAV